VSLPLTESLILENSRQVALPGNVRYPYYGYSSGRKSFVFDLAQKKVIWEQDITYSAHVMISVDEDVVIVCNPGGITCTNFVTNEVVFSAATAGFGPLAGAIVHRNNLFAYVVPDAPGHSKLVAMSTTTKPWTEIGTKVIRPVVEQQRVVMVRHSPIILIPNPTIINLPIIEPNQKCLVDIAHSANPLLVDKQQPLCRNCD
jgi:hypothetical protein